MFSKIIFECWQKLKKINYTTIHRLPLIIGKYTGVNLSGSVHYYINELTSGVYTYSTWKAEDMNARAMNNIISIGILEIKNIRFFASTCKDNTRQEKIKMKIHVAGVPYKTNLKTKFTSLVKSTEFVSEKKHSKFLQVPWPLLLKRGWTNISAQ